VSKNIVKRTFCAIVAVLRPSAAVVNGVAKRRFREFWVAVLLGIIGVFILIFSIFPEKWQADALRGRMLFCININMYGMV
jgi:hypothetical protein